MRTLEERRVAAIRRSLLWARARDLRQRSGLPVIVTELGWLGDEVEVEIARRANGAISPVKVLVGHAATDLLALDVHERCRRYNRVIRRLRRLPKRLVEQTARRVAMVPGSPVVYTLATLSMFDELVKRREHTALSNGVIRLKTLDEEIAFYTRYYDLFAPVLLDAAARMRVARGNA